MNPPENIKKRQEVNEFYIRLISNHAEVSLPVVSDRTAEV